MDEDTYKYPSLDRQSNFMLTMWIPTEFVGRVIGKKGMVVAGLSKDSKTSISTAKEYPGSLWTPVTIIGEARCCEVAFKRIKQVVDDEVDDVVVEFSVHQSKHSIIVGAKGLTIKKLSADSSTRIFVPESKENCSSVTIEGEGENVFRTYFAVLEILATKDGKTSTKENAAEPVKKQELKASPIVPDLSVQQLMAEVAQLTVAANSKTTVVVQQQSTKQPSKSKAKKAQSALPSPPPPPPPPPPPQAQVQAQPTTGMSTTERAPALEVASASKKPAWERDLEGKEFPFSLTTTIPSPLVGSLLSSKSKSKPSVINSIQKITDSKILRVRAPGADSAIDPTATEVSFEVFAMSEAGLLTTKAVLDRIVSGEAADSVIKSICLEAASTLSQEKKPTKEGKSKVVSKAKDKEKAPKMSKAEIETSCADGAEDPSQGKKKSKKPAGGGGKKKTKDVGSTTATDGDNGNIRGGGEEV